MTDIRNLILDAKDLDLVKVSVPFWKDGDGKCVDVYIKQMSGAEFDEYIKVIDCEKDRMRKNISAVIYCLCDEEGKNIFKHNDNDIKALMGKNSTALTWLMGKVLEVNFKSDDDIKAMAKN